MRTLFVDPPQAVEDLIAERHALGQDLYDEVWEGEYHVAAAPTGKHADLQAQLIRILGGLAIASGSTSWVRPTSVARGTSASQTSCCSAARRT